MVVMLDYPDLLRVIESFKQRSKEEGARDQHALLVDFLRYGVEEKSKELEAVKAQYAAITADLQTVLVCLAGRQAGSRIMVGCLYYLQCRSALSQRRLRESVSVWPRRRCVCIPTSVI